MIHWTVGLLLFLLGDFIGIIAVAICVGGQDKAEERKRNKKSRQRCNTDGSEKGVQSNEIP